MLAKTALSDEFTEETSLRAEMLGPALGSILSRAGGAPADGQRDGGGGDDGIGRGGGAHDDIELAEPGLAQFEREGAGAELRGELHRALEVAAGDGEGGGAAALERLGGFLADVARAEEENAGLAEVAENIEGEVDGDVGDAHLAGGDGGLGADLFGGLKRFLENPVEHGAGGFALEGGGVGVLHLAEDFGLAEHLGVEAGGDFEEVLHGGAAGEAEAAGGELGGLESLARAERGLDAGDGFRVVGHAVEFDAVAGVEDGEFAQAGEGGELGLEGGGGGGVQREFFAHRERGAVVGGAEEEKARAAHGCWRGAGGAGAGWRLASTGQSEKSAAPKSRRPVHAKRRASSRPRRRSTRATA